MAVYLGYHGTRFDFRRWELRRSNEQNAIGRGFYFSSEEDSAHYHASADHPDVRNRFEQFRGSANARRNWIGECPAVITAELTIKRPFVCSKGKDGPWYSLEYGDKRWNTLHSLVMATSDVYVTEQEKIKFWPELSTLLLDGARGETIRNAICAFTYYFNWPRFLDILKCDGVIFKNAHDFWDRLYQPGEDHYIVRRPKQIKIIRKEKLYADLSCVQGDKGSQQNDA